MMLQNAAHAAKPPRTPNKYSMAAYRHDLIGKGNMSADIQQQQYHNHTMDEAIPYDQQDMLDEDDGQEDELALNQQTEIDEDYGDEGNNETDAFEVMRRVQG